MNLLHVKRYIRLNLAAIRFVLVFTFLFFLGEIVYHLLHSILSPILVDLLTVKLSTALIDILSPTESAVSRGLVISSSNYSLLISKGCEGVEGLIIVLAAIAAYPATVRQKVVGFFLGFLITYAFNILRIIVLFHALQWGAGWFDFLHLYVGQTFVIIIGVSFFLTWSGLGSKRNA